MAKRRRRPGGVAPLERQPGGVVPLDRPPGGVVPLRTGGVMARHLQRQVERILDEREGDLHTVIVQARSADGSTEKLMQKATDILREQSASRTARALFPLPLDALVPGARIRGAAKPRAATTSDLRATVHRVATTARMENMRAIKPLMALARQTPKEPVRAERSRPPGGVVPLWTARSVVMQVTTDELHRLAREDERIEGIFPNRTVRVPPVRRTEPSQLPWEVQENKASTWGLHTIGALAVWGAYGARGAGAKVAVLDTGVDDTHPDLLGPQGKKKVSDFEQFDDRGNKVQGAKAHDSDQHGTHCTGTIVGGNRSGRWIGVAPEAEVAMGLVLDGGVGTDAAILAGMEWAIDLDVDAISLSLGGFTLSAAMPDTYTHAMVNAYVRGIPIVVAVGNDGSQTAGSPGSDLFAFTVGATDYHDRAAGFSGGRTLVCERSRFIDPKSLPYVYSKPDVSAPGVDVLSTVPQGKYEVFNGTSMATPHVAGVIALLLSATDIKKKTKKNADRTMLIQKLMTASAVELGEAGQNHRFGWGRIDVLKAIGFAKEAGY